MKVLLINPPFMRLLGREANYPHLGLASLGSYLEMLGHEVRIRNLEMPLNGQLDYIGYSGLMDAHQLYLDALNNGDNPIWKEVDGAIEAIWPDVVGITARSVQVRSALRVAERVKRYHHKIRVVIGGIHATARPQDFVSPFVDDIVQGEGEESIARFLRGMNEIPKSVELDLYPLPNRDLFMERYGLEGLGHIVTTRGCPFQCIFCAQSVLWGKRVQFRSPGNIIREMKMLNKRYGVRDFTFWDDSFTIKKDRIHDLCYQLKEKGWEWRCDTRLDLLDSRLIANMVLSGCHRMSVGVESGSPRVLEFMQKGETVDQMRRQAKLLGYAKSIDPEFKWRIYVIVGFPTETEEEIQMTWDLAKELGPDRICLSVFTFYPGTPIYEEGLKEGWITEDHRWEEHSHQRHTDMPIIDEFAQWVDKYNEERGGWEGWKS